MSEMDVFMLSDEDEWRVYYDKIFILCDVLCVMCDIDGYFGSNV
jgi:hypothetical protein